MSQEKVLYIEHPVTPERKAELRAQGFKIIDARFKPAGAVEPETGSVDTNGDGKPSIDEVRAALTAKGIEFGARLQLPGLLKLLEQAELAEQIEGVKTELAEKGIEFPADATLETLQQLLEGAE